MTRSHYKKRGLLCQSSLGKAPARPAARPNKEAITNKATWYQQLVCEPGGIRRLSFPIISVVADKVSSLSGQSAAGAAAEDQDDATSVKVSALVSEGHEACVICFENFEATDDITFLPSCRASGCRAFFHRGDAKCAGITRWLVSNPACPLCRTPHGDLDDDGWQTEDEDKDDKEGMLFPGMQPTDQ